MSFYERLLRYKFTAFLILQFAFILIYPIFEGDLGEWILHALCSVAYLWMLFICSTKKSHQIINIILTILVLFTYTLDYLHYFQDIHLLLSLEQFSIFYCVVFALFYVYATIKLCIFMLTDRKTHVDTLSGTAAIYLMIALTWTFFYLSLENFMPNSFQSSTQHGITYTNWLFYSITTLVSSSYSGISPISSSAQSISILESVIGALYIAIITARIVGVDFDNPQQIRPEPDNARPNE